jgi:hypothetical protein
MPLKVTSIPSFKSRISIIMSGAGRTRQPMQRDHFLNYSASSSALLRQLSLTSDNSVSYIAQAHHSRLVP